MDVILYLAEDDDEEVVQQPDKNELQNIVRSLGTKLEDLNTCNDLITKHGAGLTKALSELEQLDNPGDVSSKLKAVNERATLFRITSSAMINVRCPKESGNYSFVVHPELRRLVIGIHISAGMLRLSDPGPVAGQALAADAPA